MTFPWQQEPGSAEYLGGHELFPKGMKCHLALNPDSLDISGMSLTIPYKNIVTAQSLTKDEVSGIRTASGALLGGLIFGPLGLVAGGLATALGWKKKKLYLTIEYKDDADVSRHLVFDVVGLEELAPVLNRRMEEAKKQE
jgi:hypothetical protein